MNSLGNNKHTPDFEHLGPEQIIQAIETAYDLQLDGTLEPYNSYVNRVYGVRDRDLNPWIVKFYRPGRWTLSAIEQEHDLLFAAAEAELPVVLPIINSQGYSLQILDHPAIPFAIFPKKSGRTFDVTSDSDLVRIGSLVGRLHRSIARENLSDRLVCDPAQSTRKFLGELEQAMVVPADLTGDFFELGNAIINLSINLFQEVMPQTISIHGDMHRGNILDRLDEGLLLIDFDDSMTGPAVQDLWMLTSDRLPQSWNEWQLLLEGYQQFFPFQEKDLELIEPLRAMRMIYYLAWQNRQRHDNRFIQNNPHWGTKAFWIKEIEDLTDQARILGIS